MFLALSGGVVIGCAGLDRDTDRPERGRVGEQRGQSRAGEGGPAEQPQVDQRVVAAPLAPHEAGPGQRGSAKACSLTAVALS